MKNFKKKKTSKQTNMLKATYTSNGYWKNNRTTDLKSTNKKKLIPHHCAFNIPSSLQSCNCLH